eukprot:4960775-Pyramimonas_sp.AAC.1
MPDCALGYCCGGLAACQAPVNIAPGRREAAPPSCQGSPRGVQLDAADLSFIQLLSRVGAH